MTTFVFMVCGTLNLQPVNCKPSHIEMASMEACLKKVEAYDGPVAYCEKDSDVSDFLNLAK